MTDYSHLTNEQLNQLIHNLSRESARSYHAGFLDELIRESKEMGLYDQPNPWRGSAEMGAQADELCKRWVERIKNAQGVGDAREGP